MSAELISRLVHVTQASGVGLQQFCDIALRLLAQGHTRTRAACEKVLADLVHERSQPSDAGWIVAEISAKETAAVYAVASELAFAQGARSTRSLLEAHQLAADALFVLGRESMRDATVEQFSRAATLQRQAAGALGGRPRRFPDEALVAFRDAFRTKHGTLRGSGKAAALEFDVTEKAISDRLRRIGN